VTRRRDSDSDSDNDSDSDSDSDSDDDSDEATFGSAAYAPCGGGAWIDFMPPRLLPGRGGASPPFLFCMRLAGLGGEEAETAARSGLHRRGCGCEPCGGIGR
jgi:hypothetical protein